MRTYAVLAAVTATLAANLTSGQWLETNVEMPGAAAPSVLTYDSAANAVYVGGAGSYLAVLDGVNGSWQRFVRAGLSPAALCYDADRGRIYSASRDDRTVSVIDGVTHSVVATISLDNAPYELCLNRANGRLYCACENSHSVVAIDADSCVVAHVEDVPGEPLALCLAGPDRLFCTTDWDRALVINCATNAIIDTILVGGYPRALCYSPQGNKLYCANYYDDDVSIIDATTDSVLATVAVGNGPWALCYVPGVDRVYCADHYSSTVTVLDGTTNAVVDTIDVEDYPSVLLYSPAQNRVYCVNSDDASISVINPVTNSVVATMSTGEWPVALCVNPTAGRLFSADQTDEVVSVFDCATNQVVATTNLGSLPAAVCHDSIDDKVYCANERGWVTVIRADSNLMGLSLKAGGAPQDVCWNPADNKVYCASDLSNTVTVISAANDSILAQLSVGTWPRALLYAGSVNRVYCANFLGNTVSVIDGATNGVVATIPVGQGPIALCYNPNASKVYTANLRSNTVSVINAATNSVVATVAAGSYPMDVHYFPAFNRVYCANGNGNSVTAIDGATNAVVATIPVASTPVSLAGCAVNNRLYCACSGYGGVQVIDCSTNTVVDTVSARTCPSDLCYVPSSNRVYAAHEEGSNVTGIHCAVNEPFWNIEVPDGPTDLSWAQRHNRLYTADYYGRAVSVIRDASVDVGPREIRVPAGEYELEDIVNPVVVGLNYGNAPADFSMWVKLLDDAGLVRYADRVDVVGLAPGHDSLLGGFQPCSLSSAGWWTARCSTCMTGDSIPEDDVLTRSFGVYHPDIAASVIVAPIGPIDTGTVVAPAGRWRNVHGRSVVFTAFMMLLTPSGERVYLESLRVSGLDLQRETLLVFPGFRFDQTTGDWTARCSTSAIGDDNRWNDVISRRFRVQGGIRLPQYGWAELASMPAAPSGKPVKDGGWLQYVDGTELIYAVKGAKTSDFYAYDPLSDSWRQRAPVPAGREEKLPGKGAAATTDDERYIYATKGNNTLGFYRYDVERDTWRQLTDVPLGASNKKVKGGTNLAWVEGDERDYVYMLKGYRNEFYRFDIGRNAWEVMPSAPVSGTNQKWDKGSWIVWDEDYSIYAHRAKLNELWRYDLETDSWDGRLTGMPLVGRSGRKKKSKDGGCAVMPDDIYALKGGNTQEFWVYFVDDDYWLELDTVPSNGSGGKRRVKQGSDLATDYADVFFALKGNRTRELWRYVPDMAGLRTLPFPRPAREGVQATAGPDGPGVTVTVVRGLLLLPALPDSRRTVIFDPSGRAAMVLEPGAKDVRHLAPGVYFAKREPLGGVSKVVLTR